jgi:hypothetical protein
MNISVLCSKYSQQLPSAFFPIHVMQRPLKLQVVPLSSLKNLLHLMLKNYTAASSMPGHTGTARDICFGPTPEGKATEQQP